MTDKRIAEQRAADARAAADPAMARYRELRAMGTPREQALAIVDNEYPETP